MSCLTARSLQVSKDVRYCPSPLQVRSALLPTCRWAKTRDSSLVALYWGGRKMPSRRSPSEKLVSPQVLGSKYNVASPMLGEQMRRRTLPSPAHRVIRGLLYFLKYGIIYACEAEAHITFPGGSHLILAASLVNCERILGIAFNFTRDDVAPAPGIATPRSRTLRGCGDNKPIFGEED